MPRGDAPFRIPTRFLWSPWCCWVALCPRDFRESWSRSSNPAAASSAELCRILSPSMSFRGSAQHPHPERFHLSNPFFAAREKQLLAAQLPSRGSISGRVSRLHRWFQISCRFHHVCGHLLSWSHAPASHPPGLESTSYKLLLTLRFRSLPMSH